jgi:putative glutamine amidotransferase
LAESAPLVGLTPNWIRNPPPSDSWYGAWRYFINASYAEMVAGAGASPVAVVPSTGEAPGSVLDRLDLIILTGGGDPDPSLYNRPLAGARAPERDRPVWEMGVYREAVARGIPILGICLGMQVIAIEHGSALIQDIPVTTIEHEGTVERPLFHDVSISSGSRLQSILGPAARVASFHHQAVERPPSGFRAAAFAEDGVLEAMESESGQVICLQWHPERDSTGIPILRALLGGRRGG